jgi:hypothetical protein
MNDLGMNVAAPVYLLRSFEKCWSCKSTQPVIAIACISISGSDPDGEPVGNEGEVFILDSIEEMPSTILKYVHARHPQFERRESKTAGFSYFMNTCSCGAHFGDFYLHSKPGGAFYPMDETQASMIAIEELPIAGTVDFVCSYSVGIGSYIFEHARRGYGH